MSKAFAGLLAEQSTDERLVTGTAWLQKKQDATPTERMLRGKPHVVLLLINPQVDFYSGGSMAAIGSDDTAYKIAALLEAHGEDITQVIVPMDMRQPYHISHPNFWISGYGDSPKPFTVISAEDVQHGVWSPAVTKHFSQALHYVQHLEKDGKYKLTIWPEHCMIGTNGSNITPPISAALHSWCVKYQKTVDFVYKNMCPLTEFYSVLQAATVVAGYPETKLNEKMCKSLQLAEKVIICGQPLSHAVNYTTRELVEWWPVEHRHRLVVLADSSAALLGFEVAAQQFLQDVKAKGVTVCTVTELFSSNKMLEHLAIDVNKVTHHTALLLINPQADFHSGGVSMVEGADDDSVRLAQLLKDHPDEISQVIVTMLSRQSMNIASSCFWQDKHNEAPTPGVKISNAGIVAGKWHPTRLEDYSRVTDITAKLEEKTARGRGGVLTIQADHCVIGTVGHSIYDQLNLQITAWSRYRRENVQYLNIDTNPYTTQASIFEADVVLPEDPATHFKSDLVDSLLKASRVLIGGQPLSTAVIPSVAHLLEVWPVEERHRLVVLEDACSSTHGNKADDLAYLEELKAMGVTVCKCADTFDDAKLDQK
eukprot:TRINITY_DN64062_c0_g1_i2.p1 TRINITY_DN64062_c0_g1~~TRINITY_DN64062_c0_g1_i2.p1  ORF type:complete len:595 (-),score=55.19 TRINITY_DN64062_c0_g1_i2:1762-3546(-)